MHKQQGSLLLELVVVIVIITLVAVGSITWLQQRGQTLKTQSYATWMLSIQQAVEAFVLTHETALKKSHTLSSVLIDGVANAKQPTLLELQQLGFLAPSFTPSPEAEIRLYQEGSCPGSRCHVHGIISSTTPFLTKDKKVDAQAQADWRMHTKGYGLIVTAQQPLLLIGNQLTVTNTQAVIGQVLVPGTVALLASTASTAEDIFAYRDIKAGRYLVLPNNELAGETCEVVGAISRDSEKGTLLVCHENKWQLSQAAPAVDGGEVGAGVDVVEGGDLSSDSINAVLAYLLNRPSPLQTDWDNGGYTLVHIRDALNYEYYFCVIGNPKYGYRCGCANPPVSPAFSFASPHFIGGVTNKMNTPMASVSFRFEGC